jgi:hypothetical protein
MQHDLPSTGTIPSGAYLAHASAERKAATRKRSCMVALEVVKVE